MSGVNRALTLTPYFILESSGMLRIIIFFSGAFQRKFEPNTFILNGLLQLIFIISLKFCFSFLAIYGVITCSHFFFNARLTLLHL